MHSDIKYVQTQYSPERKLALDMQDEYRVAKQGEGSDSNGTDWKRVQELKNREML